MNDRLQAQVGERYPGEVPIKAAVEQASPSLHLKLFTSSRRCHHFTVAHALIDYTLMNVQHVGRPA